MGEIVCRQPTRCSLALLWCRGNYCNSFGPRPKEGKETQKSIDTQEETTLGAVSENWAAEGLKDGMLFPYMDIFHKNSRSFFHKQSEALGYISAVKQTSGGSLDPKTLPQKDMLRRIFLEHCEYGVTGLSGFLHPSLSYVFQDGS